MRPHYTNRMVLLAALLAGPGLCAGAQEFTEALNSREWKFPHDHGRHDGFKTEWWYFTGNVQTPDQRSFGFQLTIFRTSMAPAAPKRPSPWATSDLYFGHAHVSDIQEKDFLVADQSSRARDGLAMASDHDLNVQLLNWSIQQSSDGVIHLRAEEDKFSISLDCKSQADPVLQGLGGLSRKGNEAGQASYYYSVPRLVTSGTLTVQGKKFPVTGLSWMDHEFSSNQLGKNQAGWDWFSLQLDDGSDLMLYRMRDLHGHSDYAFGTHVTPDGRVRYLTPDEIDLKGSDIWKSPRSGGAYPQRWAVNAKGLTPLIVQTRFNDQEMHSENSVRINYYEGAAEALDQSGKRIGRGYLEMTGYGASLGGSF